MRKLCSDSAAKSDTIVTRYRIRISTAKQRVYVYEWDGRDFDKCIKEMKCSTGLDATPTPKGTFWNTAPLKEWWYFTEFDCWAKYAWCIDGGIFFHSVIFSKQDESTLRYGTVQKLGQKASHGCVRLTVENAKWIFTNCSAGTPVIVE
ncbi:MAG: L,D-transpeptidase [Clostridia bacterium]|nr:L,D-transpeptidase [Clostridia bacterium]